MSEKHEQWKQQSRDWYYTNQESALEYAKQYRETKRLKLFGVPTVTGECAICGDIAICIDHDHKTQVFRGFLCQRCNFGLGNFRDSPEFLKKAIDYLSRP